MLGVFALGSLVSAIGGSIGVLILGRAIQGAGGAIFPLAFGIIRDEFPRERVATSIGLISATFGIGGGLGLVLAGVIVDHLSVQWIFWFSVLVTGFAALATWRYVPESPVRVEAKIDWGGAALLSLTLASLLLGVSQGNAWGWGSPGVLGLFAAALVLGAAFVSFERRVPEPMVDMELMAQRAGVVHEPHGVRDRLRDVRLLRADPPARGAARRHRVRLRRVHHGGRPAPAAQRAGDAGRGAALRLAGLALRLAPSARARRRLRRAGLRLSWRSSTTRSPRSPSARLLVGIGIGLAFAAMANLVVEAVRQDQTGVATGINTIMRSIGGSIGAQVAAAMLAGHVILGGRFPAEQGFTEAFAMSAVAAVVALIATSIIPRPRAATARRPRSRSARRAASAPASPSRRAA